MKKHLFVLLFVVPFMAPVQSFAWGKKGHALVAEVAFSLLDSSTSARVHKCLGSMTIEQAANWMDDIKSDHRNDYMKQWHYVNVEKGKSYEETKEENVINQLTRVINELQHKENMKEEDIKRNTLIIFHLTGDLHQPLHVGYGDDKGGNSVNVKYKKQSTNLHRVWDSEIIESENISLADCLKHLRTFDKEEIASLSAINVEAWMRQPHSQLSGVYNFKDEEIDDTYITRNKKVIEEDILIAGIRLSAILKNVFKS